MNADHDHLAERGSVDLKAVASGAVDEQERGPGAPAVRLDARAARLIEPTQMLPGRAREPCLATPVDAGAADQDRPAKSRARDPRRLLSEPGRFTLPSRGDADRPGRFPVQRVAAAAVVVGASLSCFERPRFLLPRWRRAERRT